MEPQITVISHSSLLQNSAGGDVDGLVLALEGRCVACLPAIHWLTLSIAAPVTGAKTNPLVLLSVAALPYLVVCHHHQNYHHYVSTVAMNRGKKTPKKHKNNVIISGLHLIWN